MDGREVIRGGGPGGNQELVCHAEECGRTWRFAVRADFDQESAFDQAAYNSVGVYATHAGDGAAGERSQVQRAGQDLVGRAGERRGTGLPAKALYGSGAGWVSREQVASGDISHYDA
jgi:hypothetical protein